MACNYVVPKYLTVSYTDLSSCLCYTSGTWAPQIFDYAVSECSSFYSSVDSTAAEIQPAANQEVYGYFAPPAPVKAEEPTPIAAQEVYGYYAPTVAPRMGG
jgi:hypothetical protein